MLGKTRFQHGFVFTQRRIAFGADVFLTSVDRVREYAGVPGSSSDALLLELVSAVSRLIESACGRSLVVRAYAETLRVRASVGELTLRGYPVLASPAPVVTLDGAALVAGTDYELEASSGILRRLAGGALCTWPSGSVVVATYSGGFAEIPADLRLAATKQARHEFRQTQAGGDRLGNRSLAIEAGGQTTYESDGLLPSVRAAIQPFVEVTIGGA